MLPSTPPAEIERRIYPGLPETTNAENFRLTEISKIEKEISVEVEHYRLVLKKYKKPGKRSTVPWLALAPSRQLCLLGLLQLHLLVLDLLSARLLPRYQLYLAQLPLACPMSTRSFNAKLISTRESILWLLQKHDSINSSVSQALNDNRVSDIDHT